MMKNSLVANHKFFGRLVLVLLLAVLAFGCSASYLAVKRGDEFVEMRNYYYAANEYIRALQLDRSNEEAKKKLCQIARQAYEQKLVPTEKLERSADFVLALDGYKELSSLINAVSLYNCLNFTTINANHKIVEMQSYAAEKYYREAEVLFNSKNYSDAIQKYQEALYYASPYKNSKEKIAESYYRIGLNSENQKQFRHAAENYIDANNTIKGYKDASRRATYLFYSLGEYFLSNGLCRNALDDFSKASQINPGFKDISNKLKKADECAITKIAFVKFDNPTYNNIAGMAIGEIIFDNIKSKLRDRASKFIRILDREELNMNSSMFGTADEYDKYKRFKGVHYLVFGKLTQVNAVKPKTKREKMQTKGTKDYSCIKTDKNGKKYESTCSKEVPVNFIKHTEKIAVSLEGLIKVVSVATGEQIVVYNINTDRSDSIEYADVMSDAEIPDFLTTLAGNRRDLKDEDSLARDMIYEIAHEMAIKILDTIDRAQIVADPVNIKIYQ